MFSPFSSWLSLDYNPCHRSDENVLIIEENDWVLYDFFKKIHTSSLLCLYYFLFGGGGGQGRNITIPSKSRDFKLLQMAAAMEAT